MTKALDVQIGGQHYKDFIIQPVEFAMKNNLNFLQACIIKRVVRKKEGQDRAQDLAKIIHEVRLLAEFEGLTEELKTAEGK